MKTLMLTTVAALALSSAAFADSHSISTGLSTATEVELGASTNDTSAN